MALTAKKHKPLTLRDAREQKGLTQEQLAKLVGVDQATISQLEAGRRAAPKWPTVARLARELGVDPYELFPLAVEEEGE